MHILDRFYVILVIGVYIKTWWNRTTFQYIYLGDSLLFSLCVSLILKASSKLFLNHTRQWRDSPPELIRKLIQTDIRIITLQNTCAYSLHVNSHLWKLQVAWQGIPGLLVWRPVFLRYKRKHEIPGSGTEDSKEWEARLWWSTPSSSPGHNAAGTTWLLGPTVARETSRLVSWCLKGNGKSTCYLSQREILPQLFRNVQDKDQLGFGFSL